MDEMKLPVHITEESLAEFLAKLEPNDLAVIVDKVCNRFERGPEYRVAQAAWVAMDVTLVSLRRGEKAPQFDRQTLSKGPK